MVELYEAMVLRGYDGEHFKAKSFKLGLAEEEDKEPDYARRGGEHSCPRTQLNNDENPCHDGAVFSL